MLLHLSQFSPFALLYLAPTIPQAILMMLSMPRGHAYVFFGYSISCAVLYILVANLYLFVLLNPFTFFVYPMTPVPSGNHQNVLCIYDPVSVFVACLFCFLD